MRKLIKPILLAALMCGCGQRGEREPNDDYGSATPIRRGKVHGTVEKASDVDMFRLNMAQEMIFSAHVGGIRDVDFVLSVCDQDHRELMRVDETSSGGDEEVLDVWVHQPGPYYIVLSNKNPQAKKSSQLYVMEVKLEKTIGREQRPNETSQTASHLEIPGVTRGHYWPITNLLAADTENTQTEHWFRVDVTTGLFLLNLDINGVSKVDPIMQIFDANGYKLKEVEAGGGEGLSLKNFGVRGPVLYKLRLRAKSRVGNRDQAYEIFTELTPYHGDKEFEPNEQRADATPFEQDGVTGAVAPVGDLDWYRVAVQDDGKQFLRASVSGVDGLDLALTLCDALGTPLVVADNMGKGQPEILTDYGVAKGDYYLVISEKTGRKANPAQTYKLAKSLTPWQPGLEFESNDSTATAQAIKIAESMDGYIAPKGDMDWYLFNVYQKGAVLFELAGVPNLQFVATVYDQEYQELQAWMAPRIGESLSVGKDFDAGTYYLKLRGNDPAQSNVRDKYSLRLKVR